MSEWTTPGLERRHYAGFRCCRHCEGPWQYGHSSPCAMGCEPLLMTEDEYDLLMIMEDSPAT